jgi:hypothetical protein
MPQREFTFHEMLHGCRERNSAACDQFVRSYLPLLEFWVDHYFPFLRAERDRIIVELLQANLIEPGGVLTTFKGSWEREFLYEWRLSTFKHCCAQAAHSDRPSPPPLLRDPLLELLTPHPLLHQQLIWFHLCCLPAEEIVQILSVRSEVVKDILARTLPPDIEVKWASQPEGGVPLISPKLLIEIDSEKGEACVSVKMWSKIIDGQALWAEKEKAEAHSTNCLYCLTTVTALKETIFKLRKLVPADPLRVDKIVTTTWGRPAVKQSSGSSLGRLFK